MTDSPTSKQQILERLRDASYAAGQCNIKSRFDEELRLLKETTEIIEALAESAAEKKPASTSGALALVRDMLADKDAEIARLRALLNTPETANFLEGVRLEAAHQRERWGAPHDREKSAEHWYWLVGYLGGKALRAAIDGVKEKAQHHTISSAAALSHWHAAIAQDTSGSGVGRDADLEAHDNGLSGEIHGQG